MNHARCQHQVQSTHQASSPACACIQALSRLETGSLFLALSGTETKNPLLLPRDSDEECLESMGSVWGSFEPAAASEKNPFFIPATRLARK